MVSERSAHKDPDGLRAIGAAHEPIARAALELHLGQQGMPTVLKPQGRLRHRPDALPVETDPASVKADRLIRVMLRRVAPQEHPSTLALPDLCRHLAMD